MSDIILLCVQSRQIDKSIIWQRLFLILKVFIEAQAGRFALQSLDSEIWIEKFGFRSSGMCGFAGFFSGPAKGFASHRPNVVRDLIQACQTCAIFISQKRKKKVRVSRSGFRRERENENTFARVNTNWCVY